MGTRVTVWPSILRGKQRVDNQKQNKTEETLTATTSTASLPGPVDCVLLEFYATFSGTVTSERSGVRRETQNMDMVEYISQT